MRSPQFKVESLDELRETNQDIITANPDLDPNPEESAVTELQKRELRLLVAALPELHREVVVRAYGLDLPRGAVYPTQEVVARSLGLSTSQVGRILQAARYTLRHQLEMAA